MIKLIHQVFAKDRPDIVLPAVYHLAQRCQEQFLLTEAGDLLVYVFALDNHFLEVGVVRDLGRNVLDPELHLFFVYIYIRITVANSQLERLKVHHIRLALATDPMLPLHCNLIMFSQYEKLPQQTITVLNTLHILKLPNISLLFMGVFIKTVILLLYYPL